jgi:hypothetical protein
METRTRWTWSDKLAIALACLAAAMALALLWMDKTPIWAATTIGCMAALVVYPVFHFVYSWSARIPVLLVVWGLIGIFGWRIWPHAVPPSPPVVASNPTPSSPSYELSGGLQWAVLSTDDPVKLIAQGHLDNRGDPLVLQAWRVSLESANSAPIFGIIQEAPDKNEVIPVSSTAHITIPKGPTLDSITKAVTLRKGANANGLVIAEFPLTQSQLKNLFPVRVVVSVDDPNGKPYSMEGGPFTGKPVTIPVSNSRHPAPCSGGNIKIGELDMQNVTHAIQTRGENPCIAIDKAKIVGGETGIQTGVDLKPQ